MDRDRLIAHVAEVRQLMDERLRLHGRSLEAQVRKAGRIVPRGLRREAQYLVHVEMLAQNPKLLRMIDPVKAARAHAALVAWLSGISRNEIVKTRLTSIGAVIALNLLLIGGAIVALLVWRGIV